MIIFKSGEVIKHPDGSIYATAKRDVLSSERYCDTFLALEFSDTVKTADEIPVWLRDLIRSKGCDGR